MRIKGVDISRAQEIFDFEKAVADGVQFVIIRAGIRTDTDTYFERNESECDRLNIPYGLYWFFEATDSVTFERELSACLATIKGTKPLYPVYIDMETIEQMNNLTTAERTDMVVKFCEIVKGNGFPSGIYANPNWLENYYDKSRIIGKYDIWLAHWTGSPDEPSKYDYGQKIWQWGIDRIGKDVDGDICYVDYPKINADRYSANQLPEEYPGEGDGVILKNAPLYISSTAKHKSSAVSGTYYIYCDGVINNRIRITTPKGCKDCTGWVNLADCKNIGKPATTDMKVGSKVRVKSGARTYTGEPLSSFVYDTVYTVIQAGLVSCPDYIVIGIDGRVTAAVREAELIRM